jgi:HTH-type transcriptional regulator/antitoxin HipB
MDYPLLTAAQLAAHLRSLRKARNLTQAQLGAKLGVKQARIGKIERDPRHVSIAQLMKILAVLGARLVLQAPTKQARAVARSVGDTSDW